MTFSALGVSALVFIKPLNEIQPADISTAGDKAVALGNLIDAGFDVPPGFCVLADAYRETIADSLNEKIVARLAATEIDDPMDLEAATDEIRAWIDNATPSPALVDEIQTARQTLNAKFFAVRASRVFEDVPNPAASGLQQAYLGIAGDDVLGAIRNVWATPWNSRAIYFRQRKKIAAQKVTMAVVIQPMIDAEASGVMFTANPLTGATDEILIDATWGMAVIAARWKPDRFVVAKNDLALRERTVSEKTVMDVVAPEGGIQSVVVPIEKQTTPSLNDEHVVALASLGKKIETQFGQAQDIEWCRTGDQIWLLQTRPFKKK
jgi:pyruvate,water dikinase